MNTQMVPFEQLTQMAKAMAGSGLFGVKTEQQALALMLVAQAQGVSPATACVDFDIIQGKPSMTARAMLARFQDKGGIIKWIEYTDKACEAEFTHPQCPNPVRVRWTMEDAARAQLSGKENWKKYPRQMLSSRVMSEGVDRCYPSASGGFYPPEVVQDFDRKERDVTPDAPQLPTAPINPTTGALDALSGERQEVVMATAAAVRQCMAEDRPMDAYSLCETSGFSQEEKIALWTMFDSKIRAALKRMAEAERAAQDGTVSVPAKKRLEALIREHGLDRESVKAFCQAEYSKAHFSDLTPGEFHDLEARLREMKSSAEAA
jgi:hypothetical protein